jgi:small subunit ribosomal protein S20e
MAHLVKKGDDKGEAQIHKIRITLSSRNPKALEKVSSDLLTRANEQKIKVKGPVRLPTRTLRITTRQSPCGNGLNTWDRFQMKIYKRLIDLYSTQEVVKHITKIDIEPGVEVEVSVTDV